MNEQATFETPPGVPKVPTIDQLPNYGTTAFSKWLKAQNPRIEHNNFRAQTKILRGLKNISAHHISFCARSHWMQDQIKILKILKYY
jgi:hypothetical protein